MLSKVHQALNSRGSWQLLLHWTCRPRSALTPPHTLSARAKGAHFKAQILISVPYMKRAGLQLSYEQTTSGTVHRAKSVCSALRLLDLMQSVGNVQAASDCWWRPGHPGWSIWPADSEQFIRSVLEAGNTILSPVQIVAPVPKTPHNKLPSGKCLEESHTLPHAGLTNPTTPCEPKPRALLCVIADSDGQPPPSMAWHSEIL